jgi:hypothetical protein
VLRTQLATQAEEGIRSQRRLRMELFGRVLMHGFSNSARVNSADLPLFVLPGEGRGLGGSIRQSAIGVGVEVDDVLGGIMAGELHMDFFGGQQPSSGGRHFPLLRVRTAFARVQWDRGELLAGQEVPLVAGLNPVSIAAFGVPEFAAAGNLWLWLPQLRGTLELGSPARIAIQGAVLAPTSGEPNQLFDTAFDPAERSGRPYLQARLRTRFGDGGELGVGVHRGWLRVGTGDDDLVDSDAVAVDARVPVTGRLEIRAEAYTGRALRGLGGGGIAQGITEDGRPVRDRGGWVQVVALPTPLLEAALGCGVADPRDADVPAGRLQNTTCAVQLVGRPGGPLVTGVTWRRQHTRYASGPLTNDHLSLAVGFEF